MLISWILTQTETEWLDYITRPLTTKPALQQANSLAKANYYEAKDDKKVIKFGVNTNVVSEPNHLCSKVTTHISKTVLRQ